VVVTRIEGDGTMRRRVVDTAGRGDCRRWEELAAAAVAIQVPYRPVPGAAIYHLRAGGRVVLVAEHDLTVPLGDLITAVMAFGGEVHED
jgi:hypothetical protein